MAGADVVSLPTSSVSFLFSSPALFLLLLLVQESEVLILPYLCPRKGPLHIRSVSPQRAGPHVPEPGNYRARSPGASQSSPQGNWVRMVEAPRVTLWVLLGLHLREAPPWSPATAACPRDDVTGLSRPGLDRRKAELLPGPGGDTCSHFRTARKGV